MAIEETVTRFVAAADWTDECGVLLRTRKRKTELTPAEAVELAGELVDAAKAALSAADGAVRPVAPAAFDVLHLSPDCRDGNKHHACIGRAWDDVADGEVPCDCPCHVETVVIGGSAA